ncbi:ABC transporter ATP-binding protein [Cohnella abietis]|uniref:Multidrug ABC transporter ATP-binding protein n=1 Tax=Cohnella abietis TaxID=2507935 RepID=A0A3T1DCG8_9BACL|nr:ABC transporter ATP-binding protein [Cohnella abietis]BBI35789.1 multidrug ABC transporter ATP-binding protein [Cohnella abietis]
MDNETVPLFQADILEAGYEPNNPIVREVVINVHAGERVGLLGPNGAGKSTIMKGLLGQLPYWKGKILWHGKEEKDNRGVEMSSQVAYIPEQPILYERMTLWEHLVLVAAAGSIPEELFRERADKLLRRFRLKAFQHEYPVKFSKGMQQKTMLIIGFLLQPELYLVDEPFIGLDPGAVLELLDALDEERQRGAAILLTTHVLDSAERLCDRFVLVNDGGVAAAGTLDDIRITAKCGPEAHLFECFHKLTYVDEVQV